MRSLPCLRNSSGVMPLVMGDMFGAESPVRELRHVPRMFPRRPGPVFRDFQRNRRGRRGGRLRTTDVVDLRASYIALPCHGRITHRARPFRQQANGKRPSGFRSSFETFDCRSGWRTRSYLSVNPGATGATWGRPLVWDVPTYTSQLTARAPCTNSSQVMSGL